MKSRKDDSALQVSLGALKLRNPVMAASGTFGYGEEYASLIPVRNLGAIVTKGLSLEPRKGNPPPRLAETPAGMLNAIGLENVGLEVFLREKLPRLRKLRCPVIVNTSFNVRGEPIVMSPEHAYLCFMRTEMDYLVLGPYILDKKKQPALKDDADWRSQYVLD